MKRFFRKPWFVILLSILLGFLIMLTRASPKKREVQKLGILVDVLKLEKTKAPIIVQANGEVQAKRVSDLSTEVSGRIVWLSDRFEIGGEFKKGEVLFKIDSRDYEIQLEIAKAEVEKAKEELARIRAEANVAKEEWELARKFLNEVDSQEKASPLVLLKPQVRSAEAKLNSAKANLKLAELNLSRLELRAPYQGYLESKNVDLGQYLRAAEIVGRFVGKDRAEILLSLSASEFWWLKQGLSEKKTLPAKVSLDLEGRNLVWQAELDRLLDSLDQRGRLYRAIVSVDNPYQQNQSFPLNVGSFVQVEIDAGILDQAYPIPAFALRENDQVWLFTKDQTLEVRTVEVIRRTKETVYLNSANLKEGEELILTTIKVASPGIKLRTQDKEAK